MRIFPFLLAHTEEKPREDSKKVAIDKPGRKASPETDSDGTLNFDFSSPELWENLFLFKQTKQNKTEQNKNQQPPPQKTWILWGMLEEEGRHEADVCASKG